MNVNDGHGKVFSRELPCGCTVQVWIFSGDPEDQKIFAEYALNVKEASHKCATDYSKVFGKP